MEKIITLLRKIFEILKNFVNRGDLRTIKMKKNVIAMIIRKGISVGIGFLMVPIILDYLDSARYGIWLTLSSFIAWFYLFDIGLSNGFRNRFAEAIAKNKKELARVYVSTTYFFMIIIMLIIFACFFMIYPYVNWLKVLNAGQEMHHEIYLLVLVVFGFFCAQFVVRLISTVLLADQRPALSEYFNTISSIITLVVLLFLKTLARPSILYLGVLICSANLIVPLIASVWLFKKDYREFFPAVKYIRIKYAKDLFGLGLIFFVMQIASIVVFATDNMIITQLFGPREVIPYQMSYKYFSLIMVVMAILTKPFWSAATEAYAKKDLKWIRNSVRALIKLWTVLVIIVLLMYFISGIFFEMWLGDRIIVPGILLFLMGVWVIISAWVQIFGNFINGVGKIRLSSYHSIFVMFLNIPLSIYFAKYLKMGTSGVILATIVCVLPQALLHPIQYKKIISGKARGIWAK